MQISPLAGARFGEPCHYPFVTGMEEFPCIVEIVKAPEEKRNFGGASPRERKHPGRGKNVIPAKAGIQVFENLGPR